MEDLRSITSLYQKGSESSSMRKHFAVRAGMVSRHGGTNEDENRTNPPLGGFDPWFRMNYSSEI